MLTGNEASAGILDDLLGYGSGQSYQYSSANFGSSPSAPQSNQNTNYQYTVTYHGPGGAVAYRQGQPIQAPSQVGSAPQAPSGVRYAAAPADGGYASGSSRPIPAQRTARPVTKKSQRTRTSAQRVAPVYPPQQAARVQSAYPQYGRQSYGNASSYGQTPQAAYPNYGSAYRQPSATTYVTPYYSYGGWQSTSGQACVGRT